jgi:hypothetical protein
MADPAAAGCGTCPPTRPSAPCCAPTATTTSGRSCGTRSPCNCGGGPPSLRRAVARLAGLTAAEAGRQVGVAFAKVAEYQARHDPPPRHHPPRPRRPRRAAAGLGDR